MEKTDTHTQAWLWGALPCQGAGLNNGKSDHPALFQLLAAWLWKPHEDSETSTEEKPRGNSATMFIIVVIIAGVGVGYYFLKNKKRRDDLAEAEEMDAFDTPDDTEIEEGDIEVEEDEEDEEDQLSDEELEDAELEYFDEEDNEDEPVPEGYDEEDSDPEAEKARFRAYVANIGNEE